MGPVAARPAGGRRNMESCRTWSVGPALK